MGGDDWSGDGCEGKEVISDSEEAGDVGDVTGGPAGGPTGVRQEFRREIEVSDGQSGYIEEAAEMMMGWR